MPMNLDLLAIQEHRNELVDKIEFIQKKAKEENRDLTDDEAASVKAMIDEHKSLAADEKLAQEYEDLRKDRVAKQAAAVAAAKQREAPPLESFETKPEKPKLPAIPKSYGRLKAFTGPDADREAYDAGQFVLATMAPPDPQWGLRERKEKAWNYCVEHGIIKADAQTADDATKGGYLVPDGFSRAIIRVVESTGICRQLADVISMDTETLTMSKRSGGLTVYAPAEAGTITSSEITWTPLALNVTDRATLTRVSLKLLRSSVTNIADRVAEEIGYAAAYQMDNEFINGTGTSTYFGETGLVSAIGSAGVETGTTTTEDTWGELTLTNHTNAIALLPSRFFQAGRVGWICSPPYWAAVMLRLEAAAGGNRIADIRDGGGRDMPMFLGYPVYFTDQMPTSTAVSTVSCLFGNFRAAAMLGDRVGISIASSSEKYFDSAEIAIRGMWAYDILVHEPGDASNAGAYVAVKTGAAS